MIIPCSGFFQADGETSKQTILMAKSDNPIPAAIFSLARLYSGILPRSICLWNGRLLGRMAYCADKKHRRLALTNLAAAFPTELSKRERNSVARRSFAHFSELFFDLIKLSTMKSEHVRKLIDYSGEEHLQRALGQNRGVLIISAHFGNWEIAPLMISRLAPLYVVARPLDNRPLERRMIALRERFGARVIYKQQASKHILRALRDRSIVAILIDQNVLREHAVFVDFFGKTAATTPGAAMFHLRTGAPIVPVFAYPTSGHRYRIDIMPALRFASPGGGAPDVTAVTQACTRVIEDKIRRHPHLWLWFHDRWRSRPAAEAEARVSEESED